MNTIRHILSPETVKLIQAKMRARRALPDPAGRRRIREEGGLSQDDIAQALGVTRAAVSRWEAGEREPTGEHLLAYLEVLALITEGAAA